jgi:hypothetical protein
MRRLLHALTISTTLERCQSFGHPVPAGWRRSEEEIMKNPLDSLWGTVICGVLLTAILYFVVKSILT